MKTYKSALTESITAGSDVVKNRFAGFDGNYASAGAKALGVFEVDTDSGKQAPVIVYGIAIVEAGGAISQGGAVEVGSDGKALAHNTGEICGYALDAASAAGDLIRIKIV